MTPTASDIAQAAAQLSIDVPIRRAEARPDGSLILHTRNGSHTWRAKSKGSKKTSASQAGSSEATPEDLTSISGIGQAAQDKLNAAGITTFEQLERAPYTQLVDLLGARTANAITDYFAHHAE